jgi:hypothetical protein
MTPVLQLTAFYDNMPNPMTSFMYALDKLTEIAQEQSTGPIYSILNNANCTTGQSLQSVIGPICVPNGVPSVNGITGPVTIAAGTNMNVTTSGNIVTLASTGGGGGSGTVGSGTAQQVAVYPATGTFVAGASSLNGISVDGASPTAIGYTANLSSDAQAQFNAVATTYALKYNPTITGTALVENLKLYTISGLTQCLQVDIYGNVTGTGGLCNYGSGTVGSGTGGYYTWYSSTGTTVGSNPHLDDGVTTALTTTLSNENLAVNNPSSPSQIGLTPNSNPPAVVAGMATLAAPATVVTPGTYVLPSAPATGTMVATNVAGVASLSIIQRMAGTPTFAGGAGSGGSGPSYTLPTCAANNVPTNYTCSDLAGVVTLTTGSSPAGSNATVFTITFSNIGYTVIPVCQLSPADAATDALPIGGRVHFSAGTSTSTEAFFLIGATGLTGATTYTWAYQCALPL